MKRGSWRKDFYAPISNAHDMEIVNYFEENAPIFTHPALTPQRTEREVDFVLALTGLRPPATALDVGCGFGRHTIALARRGFDVTGIDPSEAMLTQARQLASKAAVSPAFIQASGETYETDKRFDAALCLFNTLGQVSLYGDNRELVPNVARLLVPNGPFVVEVPNWDRAVASLKIDEAYGTGDDAPLVSRQFYEESGLILEIFRIWVRGRRRVFLLKYQLFRQEELAALLDEAGFAVEAWFGDYDGSTLTADSPRVIAVAHRL